MNRVQITFNLAFATFTSFIDLFCPKLIPGTTFFIVKRVNTFINNGLEGSSGVCKEVSASTGESCIMDETSCSDPERDDDIEEEHSSSDEL
jgi:hypothetical protein